MPGLNRGHIFGAILGFVLYYSSILVYNNIIPPFVALVERYKYHYYTLKEKNELLGEKAPLFRAPKPLALNENIPVSPLSTSWDSTSDPTKVDSKILAIESNSVTAATSHNIADASIVKQPMVEISPSTSTLVSQHSSENSKQCLEMKVTHHVAPGSSWGSLPLDMQRYDIDCNS
jgi:hypothetical protein